MYTYLYDKTIHTHTHVHVHTFVSALYPYANDVSFPLVRLYIYPTCIYKCTHTYVGMFVYTYTYLRVYIYKYIYTYIDTSCQIASSNYEIAYFHESANNFFAGESNISMLYLSLSFLRHEES